jgi:bifunctional DNA-binding transcriptional regulator/antitoxin component of YhaV-PrlF toxin-antitoxin module
MIVTKISKEFTLRIPEPYREIYGPGQEVAISADPQGRLVITPIEQVRAILAETSGIWADHADLAGDSLDIMDELRKGSRLSQPGLAVDEAD